MSKFLAMVAERVLNQPLLIMPEKLAVVALVLQNRLNIEVDADLAQKIDVEGVTVDLAEHRPSARAIGERRLNNPADPKSGYKPYRMTSQGAAVVPVMGSLVNRGGFMDALSGITSYEGIKSQLAAATADPEVSSIFLHIDSGGGEAVGAFGAADAVRAASRSKPVYAVTDGIMASAAYAIASGASKIIAGRDSMVGSIGTALLHMDHSKLLADVGVKPTLFTTGKKKQQGHPFFELTDEVRADLRDHVNRINANFISTVSDHRGVDAQAVRDLEAGVFIGAEAIAHGLIDEVGGVDAALAELHSRTSIPSKGRSMTKTFTQQEHDQAVAAAREEGHKAGVAEGRTAAHAEGVKAGATAERERFKAVQTHENYKGRETSASHILHTTDMKADDVIAVLSGVAAAPAAKAEDPKPTGERSKDQPGGVVIDGPQATGTGGPAPAKSDFEKGQEIAAALPESMRRKK